VIMAGGAIFVYKGFCDGDRSNAAACAGLIAVDAFLRGSTAGIYGAVCGGGRSHDTVFESDAPDGDGCKHMRIFDHIRTLLYLEMGDSSVVSNYNGFLFFVKRLTTIAIMEFPEIGKF